MHNFIGNDNSVGRLYSLVLVESQFCMLKYFMCWGSLGMVGSHQNYLMLSYNKKCKVSNVTINFFLGWVNYKVGLYPLYHISI